MSEDTKVFESELEGGIKFEIHVSPGFSGRSEIAIKIEDVVVSVMSAEVKRSGNVYCRPSRASAILIKKERQDMSSTSSLNLDDVMPSDSDETDFERENNEH